MKRLRIADCGLRIGNQGFSHAGDLLLSLALGALFLSDLRSAFFAALRHHGGKIAMPLDGGSGVIILNGTHVDPISKTACPPLVSRIRNPQSAIRNRKGSKAE